MRETVLIVDPDPMAHRVLASILERFGYRSTAVPGGQAALALLATAAPPHFDAVILDFVGPEADSLELLAKLHDRPITIPVIIALGSGNLDGLTWGLRAGAADFVVKPVEPERLAVSLANALA